MAKIQYINKNLGTLALGVIATANSIVEEYAAQGFILTLRQLYYQFVARDLIPNSQKSYKRLGSIVNDARLCGLIDWKYIIDRTRSLQSNSHWDTPGDIIQSAADSYRVNLWEDQDRYVEVWIEKDALIGVIEGVCQELDVPYFSCRGYTSQSEMWVAGQRLRKCIRANQQPLIIHLGDHDPSGMDMSQDIIGRLELFVGQRIEVDRIALNYNQIEQYGPPANPTKLTDSRSKKYMENFGDESWELDALEPQVINELIRERISSVLDWDLFNDTKERQETERAQLITVAENWGQ